MSERWPGGIVRSTPVTPTGPLQNGTAPGIWTMEQAAYWTKQGLWPTAGNFLAVEDVFSTYLYTGNNGAQTINNGLNLSGQGGLVWLKNRGSALNNILIDTAQGSTFAGGKNLISNSTNAAGTIAANTFQFDSTGFSFGSAASGGAINASGNNYVSWSFREAPNFFDVVTYTGTGANQNIAHSLGSVPGMILIKRTDTTSDWQVYHRSNANTQYMVLNTTAAVATGTTRWNSTTPTSSVFTVGTDATVNASGGTYVAYLYAHDTSSTGIIQCGSYTVGGTYNVSINLGWEPQWVLTKRTSGTSDWYLNDVMRGAATDVSPWNSQLLFPNTSAAETTTNGGMIPTATGFDVKNAYDLGTYIYIAIRRGPMRTPTLGTTVFAPVAVTPSTGTVRTIGFPADLSMAAARTIGFGPLVTDRLRGFVNDTSSFPRTLITSSTAAESTSNQPASYNFWNTTYQDGQAISTYPSVYWNFRRAPSFFDEVCWTNTGATQNVSHNLGVVPELIITKRRPTSEAWQVYSAATGASAYLVLNSTAAVVTGNTNRWNATAPTSTVFTTGSAFNTTETYVAYLFASCPGVSKVGSYTGTGTTQTINCGFTTGARFVLIKRTDSTGDWYVWDSARGIVAGDDPYLLLNSSAVEVTNTDYIDTDNSGFQISSTAPAGINANGGSYIFLAIS